MQSNYLNSMRSLFAVAMVTLGVAEITTALKYLPEHGTLSFIAAVTAMPGVRGVLQFEH